MASEKKPFNANEKSFFSTSEDKFLNDSGDHNWLLEAESVIDDLRPHVSCVEMSKLNPEEAAAYINLETKENKKYTVRVDTSGFSLVGSDFDSLDQLGKNVVYETLNSLLDQLSEGYRQSFAASLIARLQQIND